MAIPQKYGHPVCATCKGTKSVPLNDGSTAPCLPCSLPKYPTTMDVPGAVATGPGDTSEEFSQ